MKKRFLSIGFLIIILGIFGVTTNVNAVQTREYNNTQTNTVGNTATEYLNQNLETANIVEANSEELTTTQTTTNKTEGTQDSKDTQEVQRDNEKGLSNHDIGLIAAALVTGLGCLGAGIAVAMVASSAIGAISENPSLLGKTIIFAGLAEGIAIYGLIISIMILNKV